MVVAHQQELEEAVGRVRAALEAELSQLGEAQQSAAASHHQELQAHLGQVCSGASSTALHCVVLHFIELRCIALHIAALRCIAVHCIFCLVLAR
jgi:hypothetical protein